MKNKLFGLMAVLMIAAMILAACSPTPAPTEEPVVTEAPTKVVTEVVTEVPTEEPVADEWAGVDPTGQNIVFWHNHTSPREEVLQGIVADFNANNEYGITVTAEYQGGYPDIFNKMLPILNTADVPDLVVAYQNQAITYQLADALVDMNPLVNSPKFGLSAEEQADFFPSFFAQDIFPTFDNARLGFPPNRSMEVMFVNMDYLKELGYENPPTTPDEFKEMACKAAAQPFSKAPAGATSNGYEIALDDASTFASWTFAFGGNVYDYETNQFTYNSEAAVNAATFLQGMFNDGCAIPVTEKYGNQTDFGNGSILFTTGSSSGLGYYQKAVDSGSAHAWTVIAFPHTTADPVQNIYGASVSIPKSTPERELAAWLFLKYYTSKEAQSTWSKVSGYFPVRASVAEGMTDYFAENVTFKAAFDLLPFGTFEPPVPGYDFVREQVNLSVTAIMQGADVQTTLDELTVKANEILAEQMAQIKK